MKRKFGMNYLLKFTYLMIVISIIALLVISEEHVHGETRGNPNVNFHITPGHDTSEHLGDKYSASVFHGDSIFLIPDVDDPDGHMIVNYKWTIKVNRDGNTNTTTSNSDCIAFTVGKEHLYEKNETGVKIDPSYNSEPVEYTIKLEATDEYGEKGDHTKWVTVHPLAQHTFNTTVSHSSQMLNVSVSLVWRGFPGEAANSSGNVSEDTPVFVNISKIDSPDPNIHYYGGIGNTYSVQPVGCHLQDGDAGFIEARLSLPYLLDDIDEVGNPALLQDDLKIEHYDLFERRFIACVNIDLRVINGTHYVSGLMGNYQTYMLIIDSIYTNDQKVRPDLYPEKVSFTPDPAKDTRNVTIYAYIKNSGIAHARNVNVRFYLDGAELGSRSAGIVRGNGSATVVNYTFPIHLGHTVTGMEHHQIKIHVNKLHAIPESGADAYKNNIREKTMTIIPNATLEIESVIHEPLVPDEGDTVTIVTTLNCTGSREVMNASITFSVDGTLLNETVIGDVEAGELVILGFNFTAGKHEHRITINVSYLYGKETHEQKVWVTAPDLRILSLDIRNLTYENWSGVVITTDFQNFGNASAKNMTILWYVDGAVVYVYNQSRVHPADDPTSNTYNWSGKEGNHSVLVKITHDDGTVEIRGNFTYTSPDDNEHEKDENEEDTDSSGFTIAGLDGLMVSALGVVILLLVVVGTVIRVRKKNKVVTIPQRTDRVNISGAPPPTPSSASVAPGFNQPRTTNFPRLPPQTTAYQTQQQLPGEFSTPQIFISQQSPQSGVTSPPPPAAGTAENWNCPGCGSIVESKFAFCTNCGSQRNS